MPVMSALEAAFCRSGPWTLFARRVVLPWALGDHAAKGDVLEIGGGSGAMAAASARTFTDARITVTDVDEAMVEAARSRLATYSNVEVRQADVTALPFEPQSIDMVTSYLMLHHVITWEDALAEVSRILKPGGVFVGYDLTDTGLARWTHKVDGSAHRLIGPDQLVDRLAVAGFRDVRVRLSFRGHLMRFDAKR